LIALAKLNLLHLVARLLDKLYIPAAVYRETVTDGLQKGAEDARVARLFVGCWQGFVEVTSPQRQLDLDPAVFGEGEREALSLGWELGADWVLVDEGRAREGARQLGLPVKGTLGVLVALYRQGVFSLQELEYFILQIKNRPDIWISSKLCDSVLAAVRQ
jgi:predicted nucleic acid-binding protein